MPKRSDRHVRKVAATLDTPAARSRSERALAAASPDGPRTTRAVATPAAMGLPTSVSDSLGGTTTRDASGQVGTPGNLNMYGFLSGEDYNPDLDGFAMFPNYNKMRLSDAQVNATLLMMKLPLKAARWIAKPASDDPQDIAIADFVQNNLIEDDSLSRSWQHVLDNAMLKFDFGCSAEEITWGLGEAGEARVLDLAPRLPRTFYRWKEDPATGKLAFLQQFAPKNGQYGFWNIAAQDMVLHVRAREGNNYYGRSVLRTAYPHWWWKSQLYRIDMIGHDRFHVGIPRAALNENYNANTAPLDKLEATLKGLRSHDRGYMVQPWGVTYDVYSNPHAGTGTGGIIQSIEHHNNMIARNILQAFSAQGEQKHGSFGAAKVGSDVYFDALQGEGNEIGSELKQGVVKRLCDLNFDMRGRKYPSIVATDISATDFSQLATALSALSTAGLITPDDDLEGWVRELVDAPGLPDAMKGMPRVKQAAQAPVPGIVTAAKRSRYTEQGRTFSRPPNLFERKVLDLHGIPSALDDARHSLVKGMAGIRRQQLATVAKRIAQKDGRKTADFTDIRHKHVKTPAVDDLVKVIRSAQTKALAYGHSTVRDELKRQGVKVPSEKALAGKTAGTNRSTATSTLVSSASITARKQADTWQARILDTGLRLRRSGLQGSDLEERINEDLEDEIESGARRDASSEIHEAFGVGRELSASELDDLIEKAIYSCLLDAASCDTCVDLDGEEFDLDSAEYDDNLPPNRNCDGRDECRCVYLYVAKA